MESRLKIHWAYRIILLLIVLLLAVSLFSLPSQTSGVPELSGGGQNTAMNANPYARPDSIQINLTESSLRHLSLLNSAAKCFGGFWNFINADFLIPRLLCFAWLSLYAYHYFHSKTNKPFSIMAVPIGGHAPPFALV